MGWCVGPAFPEPNANLPGAAGSREGRASSSVGWGGQLCIFGGFSPPELFLACPGWVVGREQASPGLSPPPLPFPSPHFLPSTLLLRGLPSAAFIYTARLTACSRCAPTRRRGEGVKAASQAPLHPAAPAVRRLLGGGAGGQALRKLGAAEVRRDSAPRIPSLSLPFPAAPPTPRRPIRETIPREALCLWPALGRIFKPVSKAGRECVFLS